MALGAALGAYGTPSFCDAPVDLAAASPRLKNFTHMTSPRRAPEAAAGPKKQSRAEPRRGGAERAARTALRTGVVDPEQVQLVSRVKQAQKSHESVRTKWRDYCDEVGNGTRDPTLHTATFLRRFFELLATGNVPVCPDPLHKWPIPGPEIDEDEAHRVLVAKVKHGQQAADFKESWWAFCDSSHSGMRDPLRYDNDSLIHFLLHVAPDGGCMPDKNPYSAPPQHMSDFSDCVRRMQSSKLVWKHQWDHYSDTFGGGVRDPARHPAAFLADFIVQVVPPCPAKMLPKQLCADKGTPPGLTLPPGLEDYAAAAPDDVDGADSHATDGSTQDSLSSSTASYPWAYKHEVPEISFFSMDVMSFAGGLR